MGRMGDTKICILIINKVVGNARLRESDFHPIIPKTSAVTNCFVLYLNAYNGLHKTFIVFFS